jgi:hypothetical protein
MTWRTVVLVALFAVAPDIVAAAATNTLLKAVSFALTGRDDTVVMAEDLQNCVFRIERQQRGSDDQMPSEVFYLNNVDQSRLIIEKRLNVLNGQQYAVVEIFGEVTVYEDRATYSSGSPTTFAASTKSSHTSIPVHTREYGRLARAWKFIYSHGCMGAKSAF